MTGRMQHDWFAPGNDMVSRDAAAFLLDKVARPHGIPVGDHVTASIALLLAGSVDPKVVRHALHGLDPVPLASKATKAIAAARGIDLTAWVLLTRMGLNRKIRSPYSNSTGTLDDALLTDTSLALHYDITVGMGASWMETPTMSGMIHEATCAVVLDPKITGKMPDTVLATIEGRLLSQIVSNPILDAIDLTVMSVDQTEWAIEIVVGPDDHGALTHEYVVPTSSGRKRP